MSPHIAQALQWYEGYWGFIEINQLVHTNQEYKGTRVQSKKYTAYVQVSLYFGITQVDKW